MRPYIVYELYEAVDATFNIVPHVQNEILINIGVGYSYESPDPRAKLCFFTANPAK